MIRHYKIYKNKIQNHSTLHDLFRFIQRNIDQQFFGTIIIIIMKKKMKFTRIVKK